MARYFAYVALIEFADDVELDQAYRVLDEQFADTDRATVQYRDIEPNWRSIPVLNENAEVD